MTGWRKRQVMEMALEALEDLQRAYRDAVKLWDSNHDDAYSFKSHNAIANLRQALAQPEQEPVAWLTEKRYAELHTAQRTWVGLTKDEQNFVYRNLHNATSRKDSFWVDFANAIEAKLKELNT